MSPQEFLFNLGLEDIADVKHKHPISGSDYSLRSLLESFQKKNLPEDAFKDFVNSSSDACSLEATLAEQTDLEWREYIKFKESVS